MNRKEMMSAVSADQRGINIWNRADIIITHFTASTGDAEDFSWVIPSCAKTQPDPRMCLQQSHLPVQSGTTM